MSLSLGRYIVPIKEVFRILLSNLFSLEKTWTDNMRNVVMVIRLPRIVAAILTGAALSLSGATYQGIFRNPLVSPDMLGVSYGAGVGASIAILLHMQSWGIQLFAFLFGIAAVSMAMSFPKLLRNRSTLMLVLSGVIVSNFMSSIQGLLKYIADTDTELPSIVYWLMGSLASAKWSSIATPFPFMLIAASVLILLRWRINLLSLSDLEAVSLGINAAKLRGLAIVCSTLLTASAVCISGTIVWVGLIIPHLSRLLVGEDNRRMFPASVLLGSAFMLTVDTFARNISSTEIPLSIITGIIGAPVFILVLFRKKVTIS